MRLLMAFVLLRGIPDGWSRMPKAVRAAEDVHRRTRWLLPRPPDIMKQLAEVQAEGLLGEGHRCKRRRTSSGEVLGTCLARAVPGNTFQGKLTPWDKQGWLLWSHLHEPSQGFTLQLAQVLTLWPVLPVPIGSARVHDCTLPFAAAGPSLLQLHVLQQSTAGEPCIWAAWRRSPICRPRMQFGTMRPNTSLACGCLIRCYDWCKLGCGNVL